MNSAWVLVLVTVLSCIEDYSDHFYCICSAEELRAEAVTCAEGSREAELEVALECSRISEVPITGGCLCSNSSAGVDLDLDDCETTPKCRITSRTRL